jgi:hypothetical protein
MIHKIGKAMKERNALSKLCNFIEMDDSYFGGSAPGKRGRGAANKSKVMVAVENRGTAPGYAAMEVIESMHSNHLKDVALRVIEENQTIHTDYNALDVTFHHLGETVKPYEAMENSNGCISLSEMPKVLYGVPITVSATNIFKVT